MKEEVCDGALAFGWLGGVFSLLTSHFLLLLEGGFGESSTRCRSSAD